MKKQVMLHPGDLALTRNTTEVTTILGSCISFTMLHRQTRMAAMCHCLLSTIPAGRVAADTKSPFAYVDEAFDRMLNFFKKDGVQPWELEVKLFGGADVLKVLSSRKTVGQDNLELAHELVERHGLRLVASDVGGKLGRKIVFMTDTGSVMVRRLGSTQIQ